MGDINKYELLLLSTKELVDRYWGQSVQHLQDVIDRATQGEMTVEDIYRKIVGGQAYAIILKNDDIGLEPAVKMIMVLELTQHPQYTAMNVTAIGGSSLIECMEKHWGDICAWMRVCGIKKVECCVQPAMERILSKQGFTRTYIVMQTSIEKEV